MAAVVEEEEKEAEAVAGEEVEGGVAGVVEGVAGTRVQTISVPKRTTMATPAAATTIIHPHANPASHSSPTPRRTAKRELTPTPFRKKHGFGSPKY